MLYLHLEPLKTLFFIMRHGIYLLLLTFFVLTACSKKDISGVTGWKYNDEKEGGFFVKLNAKQEVGPNLVYVPGGVFILGNTDQEDVMGLWNNLKRRVTIPSFLMDKTEISNLDYKEYVNWFNSVFSAKKYDVYRQKILPDPLVWLRELSYNEPFVENYFKHPSFNNYPVVGVTWKQAYDFCIWRTDRVNEKKLVTRGVLDATSISKSAGKGANSFALSSYLLGGYKGKAGKLMASKSNPFRDPKGKPKKNLDIEDGVTTIAYRLPTEAEWEYAAIAYYSQNLQPEPISKSEQKSKVRGQELLEQIPTYPWSPDPDGRSRLRDSRDGKEKGQFYANFKRKTGDYMGIAGGTNDNSAWTAPVISFYPNAFGLYNMTGNVSEWVLDVYRQLTPTDAEDIGYFRGNIYKKNEVDARGKPTKDELGQVKRVPLSQADLDSNISITVSNADNINYKDGDESSFVNYDNKVSLVSDQTRVVKGGSWADLSYWLSPGTRRFLDEGASSATIGFRCAMSILGGEISLPENHTKRDGNFWRQR